MRVFSIWPSLNLDDPALQIHRFPVEPVEFRHADSGERPDGENRHDEGRRVVKQLRHLLEREDRHVIEFHAHLRDGFNRRSLLVRQVVLCLGEGEGHLDAPQHRIARGRHNVQRPQPSVHVGAGHFQNRSGELGRKAIQRGAELAEILAARAVLFADLEQFGHHFRDCARRTMLPNILPYSVAITDSDSLPARVRART